MTRRNIIVTDTLEAALDAWLEGALDELGEEPPDGLDQAGRLLGAMVGVDRRIAELDEYVARRVYELRAFHSDQRAGLDQRREHLARLIEGWALAEWERTGRKTWKLPEGEITVRPAQQRAELHEAHEPTDGDIEQVKALLPAAVKVERSILPGTVKKAAKPGAELPDYDAPDGYTAHQAVLTLDFGSPQPVERVIDSVVLLVPKPGRAGQVAKAKPKGRERP
jgi:hypothetical protein